MNFITFWRIKTWTSYDLSQTVKLKPVPPILRWKLIPPKILWSVLLIAEKFAEVEVNPTKSHQRWLYEMSCWLQRKRNSWPDSPCVLVQLRAGCWASIRSHKMAERQQKETVSLLFYKLKKKTLETFLDLPSKCIFEEEKNWKKKFWVTNMNITHDHHG